MQKVVQHFLQTPKFLKCASFLSILPFDMCTNGELATCQKINTVTKFRQKVHSKGELAACSRERSICVYVRSNWIRSSAHQSVPRTFLVHPINICLVEYSEIYFVFIHYLLMPSLSICAIFHGFLHEYDHDSVPFVRLVIA